jgi:sucrose-6-phosphate hydrolase SacC (GH32 family)
MRQLTRLLFVTGVCLAASFSLRAQDIVINTFESSTYGTWVTTGTAFGSEQTHFIRRRIVRFITTPRGAEWSGSAVVDWNNSSGFGTNALVAFFTGAAKTSDGNLPRMSNPGEFKQCLAYSVDSGRTWTKYTNNTVVPNILGGDNRDPKVFWYAPGNKWVMALWLINNDYGIFTSTNLTSWTQTSIFSFPNVIECPDMLQLPLDGNAANPKWIFWGGSGNYFIGTFDGSTFIAQTGPFTLELFFKTDGNRSGSGIMQLISQGTDNIALE